MTTPSASASGGASSANTANTTTNAKASEKKLLNKALAKAVALLDDIDFLDPVKPREEFHETLANAKRSSIGNLINTAETGTLTAKETLAVTMGAMRFAFGQCCREYCDGY